MKKSVIILAAAILAATSAAMLSGCGSGETANGGADATAAASSQTEQSSAGSDTVTISKAEYERLMRFADAADLYDMVDYYFYKEPDYDRMIEGALKVLVPSSDIALCGAIASCRGSEGISAIRMMHRAGRSISSSTAKLKRRTCLPSPTRVA